MYIKEYPEEKRKIIAEHSSKDTNDFIKFLEEIKGDEASYLQKILTPPKGFPKNKKLKTKTRHYLFKQFISKLAEEKDFSIPDSDVWNQFRQIFSWWVKSQSELFKILEKFKSDEYFEENDKSVEPNSDLDLKYFEMLQEASRNNQINQETIRRFYQFGYFLKDEKIENLIDNALTQKDIEHKQRIEELPDKIDGISKTITDLESRISTVESAIELKQELEKEISGLSASLEDDIQKLNKKITVDSETLNEKISEIESRQINDLSNQINSLKSLFTELKKSVSTLEDKRQTTESPQIAYQAVEIGKQAVSLVKDKKKQKNEKNYIEEFGIPLWRLDITNSMDSSEAKAIHVALKAFPVIEITDPRIIDAWKAACGNNLHITTLDVGMGWLASKDFFPTYFSVKCFGEELRQMDLDASVDEMFNNTNMLWAIDIRNCDLSFPESYLPDFLRWIDKHKDYTKVFLTRCLGENCCNTSFEVYNEVGQLPKPAKPESIKLKSVPIAKSIIIKSIWQKWCQPADEELYQTKIHFLEKLQSEIENIPLSILQDIKSYLLLSHQVFDPDKALDWALYLRLYPWLADRTEIENTLFNFITQSDLDIPRTTAALQGNL